MEKFREYYLKDLVFEHPAKKFPWIQEVNRIPPIVPGTLAYQIILSEQLSTNDPRVKVLEDYIINYFEVFKGRASIIPCWRHDELILYVFLRDFEKKF